MSLIVCKFGGSSLGTPEKILHVARLVKKLSLQHQLVVVLSAMAGETNRLTELAQRVCANPSGVEFDTLLSSGEQVSVALLAMALKQLGIQARSFNALQLGIHTNAYPQGAAIESINTQLLTETLADHVIPVVTGFQGVNVHNQMTTLGRGGSDTTAVALAAALTADECLIYTDVAGVYTCDPNLVKEAKVLPIISCVDMYLMSSLGAKVLQLKAIELAKKFSVNMRILSTFVSSDGTRVVCGSEEKTMNKISGIAIDAQKILCTIDGAFVDVKRVQQIFEALDAAQIPIEHTYCDMGIRSRNHCVKFSAVISYQAKIRETLDHIFAKELKEFKNIYSIVEHLSKLSVVGFASHLQGKMLHVVVAELESNGVALYDLHSAPRVLTILLASNDVEKAAKLLHKKFNFLDCEVAVQQQIT